MYCPECGSQLDNDMLFCPECGTKVEKPSAKDSEDPVMKGILFTHIPNLAQKLSVSPQEITNLLETFIRLKSEQGVLYRLADAGVESKGFFNKRKSLTPDSPWYEYACSNKFTTKKREITKSRRLFCSLSVETTSSPCRRYHII